MEDSSALLDAGAGMSYVPDAEVEWPLDSRRVLAKKQPCQPCNQSQHIFRTRWPCTMHTSQIRTSTSLCEVIDLHVAAPTDRNWIVREVGGGKPGGGKDIPRTPGGRGGRSRAPALGSPRPLIGIRIRIVYA